MNNKVVEEVRKLSLPFRYDEEQWKDCIQASCYIYAINLKINEFVLVGEFIGKRCNIVTPIEEVIETLKEEIMFLGFKYIEECRREDYIDIYKEFKICLIHDRFTGCYHLQREDEDGMWSHKYLYEPPRKEEFLEQESSRIKCWYFKIGIGKC